MAPLPAVISPGVAIPHTQPCTHSIRSCVFFIPLTHPSIQSSHLPICPPHPFIRLVRPSAHPSSICPSHPPVHPSICSFILPTHPSINSFIPPIHSFTLCVPSTAVLQKLQEEKHRCCLRGTPSPTEETAWVTDGVIKMCPGCCGNTERGHLTGTGVGVEKRSTRK